MALLSVLWEVTVIAGLDLQYSIHAEHLVSLAAQFGKAVSMLVFVSLQRISCLCRKFPSK